MPSAMDLPVHLSRAKLEIMQTAKAALPGQLYPAILFGIKCPMIYTTTPPALQHVQTFFCLFNTHLLSSSSGQAVVTGVVPSPPGFLRSMFIAHRVQQFHCPSTFHRMLLTQALAVSASQFVHKKSPHEFMRVQHALGGIRTHETDLYQARG